MTCRVEDGKTYNQVYNAENRLATVQQMVDGKNCADAKNLDGTTNFANIAATWNFIYDGDGSRVRQEYFQGDFINGVTVKVTDYFAGGSYELDQTGTVLTNSTIQITDTITRKYYAFGGQNVAMVECTTQCGSDRLNYFLTDHLGSVVGVVNATGNLLSQQRYKPFGEARSDGSISQTDFGYTGQRNNSYIICFLSWQLNRKACHFIGGHGLWMQS